MLDSEKLTLVKTMLSASEPDDELPDDDTLLAYLKMAEQEILAWEYRAYPSGIPAGIETVPREYEITQIMAVVTGLTVSGAEGQTAHTENGIARSFAYADMGAYIHRNVTPRAAVL